MRGLLHARRAGNRRLPEICQKPRSAVMRTRSVALSQLAASPARRCELMPVMLERALGSFSMVLNGVGTRSKRQCTALLGRFRVERRASGEASSVMASVLWRGEQWAVDATLWGTSGVRIDGWQEVMKQVPGAWRLVLARVLLALGHLVCRSARRRGRRPRSLVSDGRSGRAVWDE
jgi:hypothetical protein